MKSDHYVEGFRHGKVEYVLSCFSKACYFQISPKRNSCTYGVRVIVPDLDHFAREEKLHKDNFA